MVRILWKQLITIRSLLAIASGCSDSSVDNPLRTVAGQTDAYPSVIAWECSLNESPMPSVLVDALNGIVHEEYPGDQAYSAGWVPERTSRQLLSDGEVRLLLQDLPTTFSAASGMPKNHLRITPPVLSTT